MAHISVKTPLLEINGKLSLSDLLLSSVLGFFDPPGAWILGCSMQPLRSHYVPLLWWHCSLFNPLTLGYLLSLSPRLYKSQLEASVHTFFPVQVQGHQYPTDSPKSNVTFLTIYNTTALGCPIIISNSTCLRRALIFIIIKLSPKWYGYSTYFPAQKLWHYLASSLLHWIYIESFCFFSKCLPPFLCPLP